MPSLSQLIASHSRILVLDAASTIIAVGMLRRGESAIWAQGDGHDASRWIFEGTQLVLNRAGIDLHGIDAFVFCVGPGSMLGTRTVAMALRTWMVLKPRPVYSYQSLAVASCAEWVRRPRAFTMIADARREAWHAQSVAVNGTLAPLQRIATTDLPAGELLTPAPFRAWSIRPAQVTDCEYEPAEIFPKLGDTNIFQESAAPDAFQHDSPDYKKWSAQTHSAETAPRR